MESTGEGPENKILKKNFLSDVSAKLTGLHVTEEGKKGRSRFERRRKKEEES